MTYNRGKPLKAIQKDAIVEGLKGSIKNLEERAKELRKQLADIEKEKTEN